MNIRKIKVEELDKLINLYKCENFEKIKEEKRKQFERKNIDIYVIEEDRKFIGEITVIYKSEFKSVTIPNIRVFIGNFIIQKNYQNKRLGQMLLDFAIKDLENQGVTEFTIKVEDDDEISKHIYEKFDFTEVIDKCSETKNDKICKYSLLLRKSNSKKIEKLILKFNLGSKIEKIEQIYGGLSNRMYKVKTDKNTYAIKKLNKTLMKSKDEFERIIFAEKVSKVAEENGILVERALEFNKKIIHEMDYDYFMIFNWNNGKHLNAEDINEEICIKIGKLLASIHNLELSNLEKQKDVMSEFRTIDWEYYIKIAKKQNKKYSEQLEKNKGLLYELNKKINEALEYAKNNLIISHRDLIKRNILWNDNIPTVIDWESSGYINPTVELVQVCWNWANGDVGCLDFEKFQIIVNEYLKDVKKYKKEDMKKLIYANLCEALDWLEYNLKRSLCIDSTYRKEEIELAEKEIEYLNEVINYAVTQIEQVATISFDNK